MEHEHIWEHLVTTMRRRAPVEVCMKCGAIKIGDQIRVMGVPIEEEIPKEEEREAE